MLVRFIIITLAATLLAGCTHSTAKNLERGKQEFFAERYDVSFKHLTTAAEAGDADAQYALGYMYYYGKGADQDMQLGRKWIAKAAVQGQPQAIKALAMLNGVQSEAAVIAPQQDAHGGVNMDFAADENSLLQETAPYTLQLLGTNDKAFANNFVAKHNLIAAKCYRTTHNNQPWYVVVSGAYASVNDAEQVLHNLPKSLRAMQPWIKPMAKVKAEINHQ